MSNQKAILHYFDGRGKAEIIRLVMAASGVEWETINLREREQFLALKAGGNLLFGQVPLVEFEGKKLVQSSAIARFFASRANLLGENEEERLKIDILYEGARDFQNAFMGYGFDGFEPVLESAKANALPKYLPVFNQSLKENGSNGYLVGSKLSLADIALFETILTIEELLGDEHLQNYHEIQKFSSTMKSIKELANYLNGPQRPRKNDEKYVREVKTTLNF